MIRRFFDTDLPFAHYCWNVLVFSTLSLLPFLMIYIGVTPGFAEMLATNGTALSRFMRQVLTNGLPVVFLINYAGFVAASVRQRHIKRAPIRYVFLDGLVRAIFFVGLHALIYVVSADLFDSFGGDRGTALHVVGPTLQRAWLFENISGVYLYGIAPGALVVYLVVLRQNNVVTIREDADALQRLPYCGLVALTSCLCTVISVTLISTGMIATLGRP